MEYVRSESNALINTDKEAWRQARLRKQKLKEEQQLKARIEKLEQTVEMLQKIIQERLTK